MSATLLTPLYGRAHATDLLPGTAFRDPIAARLLAQTGYRPPEVLTDRGNAVGSVHRAIALDAITTAFAARCPQGVVLSAGIGLDTRAQRLREHTPASLTWLGADLPEVIQLRRALLPEDPVTLFAASVTEPGWYDALTTETSDRPVLVIAEGLLMYFEPDGLRFFLDSCRTAFGPGAELAGDYFHPRLALSDRHPIVRATGARFRSGAANGHRLAATAPGWHLVAEHPVMERISPLHRAAAGIFRLITLGSRPYAVAHLKAGALV
ncbi:class I SAM-dependent methyltransferase [Streptomyces albipurpureus]|uniref:Class I SAM-dependent methyltransferase n=1 Tax=Streptomyces albipurpureus TaxID=2897419 RepID=A0ABT0UPE5_9ACTN|nr:class I SAM-dependent methyltransferase [Streptomyces sp. CWNU-1]MCM2390499.1 class I SAM-dependent methyltransferase [Streptomyces sp. CWNU-1]